MKRFIRPVLLLGLMASIATAAQPSLAAQQPQITDPNCTPNVVPSGQANPSSEIEPLAPIWCFNLTPEPTTRLTGSNDWLDGFQTNVQMGRLNDGDMDYRIFDIFHHDGGANHTQHFINNNHWMTDTAGAQDNGDALRPNRSFTFEKGKLVVEADIAAGMSDYGNSVVWPEITVSMAPQPTGNIVDSLYAYGGFGGYWTVGCRLHPAGNPTCSVESSEHNITRTDDAPPCFASAPSRIMEIADTQICGTTHVGGNRNGDNANYWRRCDHNQMDMFCRDRIRMEITKSSLTLYVNGHLYFDDSGWDAEHQLPDSMVNGGPVYTYFSDWRARPTTPVYRFHWGRLAVNPHDASGNLAAPSAAPSFCLGMTQNTCAMDDGSMSTTPTQPATMPAMPGMDSQPATTTFGPPPADTGVPDVAPSATDPMPGMDGMDGMPGMDNMPGMEGMPGMTPPDAPPPADQP